MWLALVEKFSVHDRYLAESCRIANGDPEVRAIEEEFEAITAKAAESRGGWL
jgi:hypothetical protein